MQRFALELSYDGTNYHGWQCQKNAESIQSVIEARLFQLLQVPIKIFGCGRTDAGVHADHYIAHFEADTLGVEFVFRLNKVLPNDIAIHQVYKVPSDFHARFQATRRTYVYTISKVKDSRNRDFVYWDTRVYDVPLMNKACDLILAHTDFGAFCKNESKNKTNRCHVDMAEWSTSNNLLIFTVRADRFLRNMVRAMVGTMLELGRNRISLDDFQSILVAGNRESAGPSAPAQGLSLTCIEYDRNQWSIIESPKK